MSNKTRFGEWNVERTIKGGRVFHVSRETDDTPYVLKTTGRQNMRVRRLNDTEVDTDSPAESIRNEIAVLKRLTDHPNIITMVDYDSEAQTPWHVTEYCGPTSLRSIDFNGWDFEDLKDYNIKDKLRKLAKAYGYAHSQGIILGHDVEAFEHNKEFILGDLEGARIWDSHYVDTTKDIRVFMRLYDDLVTKTSSALRIKARARNEKKQVEGALEQAQPSAPRRLVAE